jgi:hypothetical protein
MPIYFLEMIAKHESICVHRHAGYGRSCREHRIHRAVFEILRKSGEVEASSQKMKELQNDLESAEEEKTRLIREYKDKLIANQSAFREKETDSVVGFEAAKQRLTAAFAEEIQQKKGDDKGIKRCNR